MTNRRGSAWRRGGGARVCFAGFLVATAAVLVADTALDDDSYRLVAIPDPLVGSPLHPVAVSESGFVVGTYNEPGTNVGHAYAWSESFGGYLSPPPGSIGTDVNDRGQAVGYVSSTSADAGRALYCIRNQGWRLLPGGEGVLNPRIDETGVITGNTWTDAIVWFTPQRESTAMVVNVSGSRGYTWSNIGAASDHGVLVGSGGYTVDDWHYFVWETVPDQPTGGTFTELSPFLSNDMNLRFVNDDGDLAGEIWDPEFTSPRAVFRDGTTGDFQVIPLPTVGVPAGSDYVTANVRGMNADGTVIGVASSTLQDAYGMRAIRAWVWDPATGVCTDLGTLGGAQAEPTGIDDLGNVVGISSLPPGTPGIWDEEYGRFDFQWSFVWDASHGMRRLRYPVAEPTEWAETGWTPLIRNGRAVGGQDDLSRHAWVWDAATDTYALLDPTTTGLSGISGSFSMSSQGTYIIGSGYDASFVPAAFVAAPVNWTPASPMDPIVVTPSDEVSMTFSSTSTAGTTTVEAVDIADVPALTVPNFTVSGIGGAEVYEISTTATFSGWVHIRVQYDPARYLSESSIRLFHYEGGQWRDVTYWLDTVNNDVVGFVTSLSPFAILEAVPPETVTVDVKPGDSNVIQLSSNGTVAVAILGSADFVASDVDLATVRVAGAAPAVRNDGRLHASFADVNSDGRTDAVVHFDTSALSLPAGEQTVEVTGAKTDGWHFRGSDVVVVRSR